MRATRKARRLVLALAVVAAASGAWPAVSTAAEPADDAPCVRQQMPVPGGVQWRRVQVLDADPSGRYQLGYGQDEQFQDHLIRWADGTPQDLGTGHGTGTAINGHGDIVGSTWDDAAQRSTGWRYHDGRFTDLPTADPGGQSAPSAIGEDGTVVGSVFAAGRTSGRPAAWSPDDVLRLLPLPDGDNSGTAADIDEDGTVVGSTSLQVPPDVAGPAHPVRWRPDGALERLEGYRLGPETATSPTEIRGGTVVGVESEPGSAPSRVLLWKVGATKPEMISEGSPEGLNASGAVVVMRGPNSKLFFLKDGTTRSLPSDDTDFPLAQVTALTDGDVAFGWYFNSTPGRWDC